MKPLMATVFFQTSPGVFAESPLELGDPSTTDGLIGIAHGGNVVFTDDGPIGFFNLRAIYNATIAQPAGPSRMAIKICVPRSWKRRVK